MVLSRDYKCRLRSKMKLHSNKGSVIEGTKKAKKLYVVSKVFLGT